MVSTAAKIAVLIRKNPDQTLQELGDQVGVTRERVRQLIMINGIQGRTKFSLGPRGPMLAVETLHGRCGECSYALNQWGVCKRCRPRRVLKEKLRLLCYGCGKIFLRPEYLQRSKMTFCSKICFGRYAGKHFGFGVTKPKSSQRLIIEQMESQAKIILDHEGLLHQGQKCSFWGIKNAIQHNTGKRFSGKHLPDGKFQMTRTV